MSTLKNKQEIIEEIKSISLETGSIIDAVVAVCFQYNIEIETIARYIKYSKEMKEQIRHEGIELNMLKT